MEQRNIHLLCTGDLHLGRHPTKIPEEYDSRDFSPVFIWEKIVRKAVKLDIDALLISGDIVDRDNRFYEAFGPFEAGIKKLAENNISVFTTAGNHDYNVLPDIARNIDCNNFYFLGAGGDWELKTLQRDGKPLLNILGWSYPGRQVRKNPLEDLRLQNHHILPEGNLPTIGLIHSEVNNPGSNYAPVSVNSLQETGITGWILGHIHRPNLINKISPFILNPGTPQPLNQAEPGIHGVWELTIQDKDIFKIVKHPLASLQYADIEIDVSDLKQLEDLTALISEEIETTLSTESDTFWAPDIILLRITLRGRTVVSREFDKNTNKLKELELKISGCRVLIENINNQTLPPIDTEGLAAGNSQVALIAEYLQNLESGNREQLPKQLLKKVESKLLETYRSNAYQPLRRQNRIQPPEKKEVFTILKNQAKDLLNSLLAQKEETDD